MKLNGNWKIMEICWNLNLNMICFKHVKNKLMFWIKQLTELFVKHVWLSDNFTFWWKMVYLKLFDLIFEKSLFFENLKNLIVVLIWKSISFYCCTSFVIFMCTLLFVCSLFFVIFMCILWYLDFLFYLLFSCIVCG